MGLWPHQSRAIEEVGAALAQGRHRLLLTCPTGGGKTRIASELIAGWLEQGFRVALYTNRKLLIDQLSDVLGSQGFEHGIRAAGHEDRSHLPLQISSVQTEDTRSRKARKLAGNWLLHDADRVIIDEAHINAGKAVQRILEQHLKEGAAYLGMTATPVDLAHLYDHLIVAGTPSELRACGALVWADHYGPDEPDLRKIRNWTPGTDLTEKQQVQAIMRPGLFGRVYSHFSRLNPERRSSILFAPGVKESVWFAQQFTAKGVRAAHIDGDDIWIDGHFVANSREARKDILDASRDGKIQVLCNRFVLREGVDAPWLTHGILACVIGSLQTYLQTLGRLLRAAPGKDRATIQDHGGNWWRHGSVNEDRVWELSDTASSLYHRRADRLRAGKGPPEPFACRKCKLILVAGKCPGCGWLPRPQERSRSVVTVEGDLIPLEGKIFRPRAIYAKPNGPQIWERMYWRSRSEKGARSFRAAMALFAMENHWKWPNPQWPLMPRNDLHLDSLVSDVPMEQLTQKVNRECAHP